jgi:hypothetical protein
VRRRPYHQQTHKAAPSEGTPAIATGRPFIPRRHEHGHDAVAGCRPEAMSSASHIASRSTDSQMIPSGTKTPAKQHLTNATLKSRASPTRFAQGRTPEQIQHKPTDYQRYPNIRYLAIAQLSLGKSSHQLHDVEFARAQKTPQKTHGVSSSLVYHCCTSNARILTTPGHPPDRQHSSTTH